MFFPQIFNRTRPTDGALDRKDHRAEALLLLQHEGVSAAHASTQETAQQPPA
jgi:hypothetical protein